MNAPAKPKVQLTERDGNAFLVLGLCIKAGRKAGWTDEQVAAFRTEAVQGSYDGLLQTAMKYFDVE